jgi:hypothetical protein
MVFDKKWFADKQKYLLWFTNTSYGRDLLHINSRRSSVDGKIVNITPNSITWREDKKYATEFRTNDKFGRRLYYSALPLWKALHNFDINIANVLAPRWNLGFDSLTAYPDAHPETTTIDGRVIKNGADLTFAGIVAAAGNACDPEAAEGGIFIQANTVSAHYQTMCRAIALFDTSSLSNATAIKTAILSFAGATADLGATKANNLGSPDWTIAASTPASNTAIANSDYEQTGSTSFGSIAYADWSASADTYNDCTLNATGLAAVSKTSVSKFSGKFSWDVSGTFGGSWSSNAASGFSINFADTAGTTYDPKLVVTYELGGSFIPFL